MRFTIVIQEFVVPFCEHLLHFFDDSEEIIGGLNDSSLEHFKLRFQGLLEIMDSRLVLLTGFDSLGVALWLGAIRIGGTSGDGLVYFLYRLGEFDLMGQHA
jgi:hypothetical protein